MPVTTFVPANGTSYTADEAVRIIALAALRLGPASYGQALRAMARYVPEEEARRTLGACVAEALPAAAELAVPEHATPPGIRPRRRRWWWPW